MKKAVHKYSGEMFPSSVTKVTIFSRFLVLFLFIMLPLAGFYTGMYYQQIFDNRVQALNPLFLNPPSQRSIAVLFLKQSDNGKTFTIPLGTRVTFALENNLRWYITSSNTTVLHTMNGNSQMFFAANKGIAVLSGTGSVTCAQNTPCPLLVAVFKTTIIVK
jgi:hypothetical protein